MKKILFILAAMFFLQGCATDRPETIKTEDYDKPDYKTGGYEETMLQNTKTIKHYENFETRLLAKATLKTPEYRKAYIAEYAQDYALEGKERSSMAEKEMEQQEKYVDFVLGFYVPDLSTNNIASPRSNWKVYLFFGDKMDTQYEPVEIQKINKKNPDLATYFPYITPWMYAYMIRFDRKKIPFDLYSTKEKIHLYITGSIGKADLVW